MDSYEHPDVTLAKQHRDRLDRIEAMRERASEPDLRAAVHDLAEIVATIAPLTDYHDPGLQRLRKRAAEIARQLA